MTTEYELPEGKAEQVGMSREKLEGVTRVIQEFISRQQIQGAVVGVARRRKRQTMAEAKALLAGWVRQGQ
ncbi:MAG: hypothetical protein O2780_03990 [Proteobacteria bacterium]|jgi:hypothetical protein|nr:hypothetical protein [Pseudomonadota bacterium]MDA1300703.1 hypothetical protein [Pseudomonadota bacterium]